MTEELVIMRDRQAVTTSLQVARDFEKNHKDVLKAWKNLAAQNCATKAQIHTSNIPCWQAVRNEVIL